MNNKDLALRLAPAALCVSAALAAAPAIAQSNGGNLGPGLVGLTYANDVELRAAVANDTTFRLLDTDCNPSGVFDQNPAPSYDQIRPGSRQAGPVAGARCTEDAFFVYLNSRELFHSANDLRDQGPTVASLGVDQEGLGTALRWTAAEEFAAQGSMATEIANSQLSNLAARISALRYGAGGFGIAGLLPGQDGRPAFVGTTLRRGGAAQGETYSPWGGFLNLAFGYGGREPTGRENAFDFDASEITLGVDYRLPNNIVIGGMLGSSDQAVDFDEAASAISVTDGGIDSDGTSFIVFALYQGEELSINGSIGTQSLDYSVTRDIEYPSFNPNTPSVYSTALSNPNADVSTATFGVGYAFTWGKFTLEPTFNAQHLDLTIDAFDEQRSINLLSGNAPSRRFDLSVSEQQIDSLEMALGVRFQYVVTPRFGVIIPYWSLEMHKENHDDARVITAGFAALRGIPGFAAFQVPTDARDDSYTTFSAGFSMVLRGGRQRELDGPIAGGLMGFLQYQSVENLQYFDDRTITGGFRYEF
jgi:outer membrane lipase/esterase